MRKPVIALIGGIGSGKSSVAAEFARRGAAVISGDQLGHEALRQLEIRNKVVERFGEEIVDAGGNINRQKLGKLVFADIGRLRDLEKLVFPYIENGLRQQIDRAQKNPTVRLIVLDAAILLEAGWNKVCDKIVYVDAPPAQCIARLAAQRGWTADDVKARCQAQLPLAEKTARADAIIDNSGLPAALAPQVTQLLSLWGIPVAM